MLLCVGYKFDDVVLRRYYELKMNLDEQQTVEEITYIEATPSESVAQRRRSKLESVDADNMISVSQEERRRYIVSAVNDPRDDNKLTLQQATSEGIIDYPTGQYVNPDTGQGRNWSRLVSTSLHCALASCGAVYCYRSCLWVCDSGQAVSEPYYSQRACSVCVSQSAFSFP